MSPSILPQTSPLVIKSIRNKSLFVEKKSPVLARPRWHAKEYTAADPLRRLAAAVTLRAVLDAFYTPKQLRKYDYYQAHYFLKSPIGDSFLREFIGVEQ